jgi:hypothetical protein
LSRNRAHLLLGQRHHACGFARKLLRLIREVARLVGRAERRRRKDDRADR